MEKEAQKEVNYWQTDFLSPPQVSNHNPKVRKDINPIKEKPNLKGYSFIVDWQVCDEEHLELEP